ncbi:pre-mRNA 3' end processing protein WDR33 isoform X2 [Nematostella vectensis]|uniref:pre-mRNA 3' end processing protein WDR33 isoform X2 n=1 Tax=Nematostella vectensis TaxID=45351 RepID=UPI00207761FE|nr:pre-mRNA 3' end processing protein WDR33 isoform X2 [Nematostella vectensis]
MYQPMHQGPMKAMQKPVGGPVAAPAADPNAEEPRTFLNRQPMVFDGKRMRKAVIRKTIDYNSCVVKFLENRKWFKHLDSRHGIQPDEAYAAEILPPSCMPDNPINAVTTKFVRTSTNKLRCPIFCVVWTPEGRRLVTGASSGEFTLWNGLTFNFETILTAHESPVRAMVWNHHDSWLLSADHSGIVKYWQSNMNNVQMYEAHKEPVRGLSFSPTDNKYASCADDGLVKIWDFYRCMEEKTLRGHGADVKCIDWHPHKSLLVSGSKDSQQPIKLWDTRTGNGLATLHVHKSTVMSIKWNQNGNWLLTASRDHLLKLFDIRAMKELQAFRGHKREATAIAWHPIHENLFASGGSDGAIMFWMSGSDKDVGNMESAHEGMVWSLAWHPLGHILCSGSNDHTSKFWTRNRLGDRMRDRYNLNIQDTEDDVGDDVAGAVRGFSVKNSNVIPGMDTTFSTSDPDFLDTHTGLPDFGSPPKQSIHQPSKPAPVMDQFTLPGFKAQPPNPGMIANPGNKPPLFGGNKPGPENHSGPPFKPGQRPYQHGGPDQFGPNGHTEEMRPLENRGPPFEPPWPQDQVRGPRPDNWGPNDPRRGPGDPRRVPGNDPRRPVNDGPKPGILGSPPRGPDNLPLAPPTSGDMDAFNMPGRGPHQNDPRNFRQDAGPDNPFPGNQNSRGFNPAGRGPAGGREPQDRPWSNDGPFGRPPDDRGPQDRPPWDGPREQDFRGPRDPRAQPAHNPRPGPQDPRGPQDRRPPNEQPRSQEGSGPKPLMSLLSLAPIAPPPGAELDMVKLGLNQPGLQRKRSGDDRNQDFDRSRDPRRDPRGSPRDWDNQGGPPPLKLGRDKDNWQFGPNNPPGPPDDRREGRGDPSFADDHWEDISWNKGDSYQSGWRGNR